MTSDERFQREVTLGKRIGLYKFRGELGTGNFARVKLAFHQLAHGEQLPLANERGNFSIDKSRTARFDRRSRC